MATVNHHFYDIFREPLQSGEERPHYFPGDWIDSAVAATAAPNRISTQYRRLTVTQVRVVNEPGLPGVPGQESGVSSVVVTVKNLGTTPVVNYFISLADIVP